MMNQSIKYISLALLLSTGYELTAMEPAPKSVGDLARNFDRFEENHELIRAAQELHNPFEAATHQAISQLLEKNERIAALEAELALLRNEAQQRQTQIDASGQHNQLLQGELARKAYEVRQRLAGIDAKLLAQDIEFAQERERAKEIEMWNLHNELVQATQPLETNFAQEREQARKNFYSLNDTCDKWKELYENQRKQVDTLTKSLAKWGGRRTERNQQLEKNLAQQKAEAKRLQDLMKQMDDELVGKALHFGGATEQAVFHKECAAFGGCGCGLINDKDVTFAGCTTLEQVLKRAKEKNKKLFMFAYDQK